MEGFLLLSWDANTGRFQLFCRNPATIMLPNRETIRKEELP